MSHEEAVEGSEAGGAELAAPGAGGDDTSAVEVRSFSEPDRSLSALPQGDRLRYKTGETIGRGGMGLVVEVHDLVLDRTLAKKLLMPRGEGSRVRGDAVTRFLREARITARLDHPGVVPVHELALDESGHAYFTMKRVNGKDLRTILQERMTRPGEWNLSRLLAILERACDTMGFAHDRGVIHRDLKPANVMVGAFGEVYVMDWGIARVIGEPVAPQPTDAELTSLVASVCDPAPSLVIGSPPYMPPEQVRARPSALQPTADVYSLGCILYEMLSGSPPYNFDTTASAKQKLDRVASEPPRPLSLLAADASPELVAICNKAMARDPGSRYATAQALGRDIRNYLEGRVVLAYCTGALVELRKWITRNRAMAFTILAAALIAIASALGFALQQRRLAEQERTTTAALSRKNEEVRAALELEQKAREREIQALRLSEGLRLVENAKSTVGKDGCLAVLLAAEALRRAPGPEARQALDLALSAHQEIHTLRGHDSYVRGGVFSEDGQRILTWAEDTIAVAWDAVTGKPMARLSHEGAPITVGAVQADGRLAATGAEDGEVRVWRLGGDGAGTPLVLQPRPSPVRVLRFHGGLLLVGYEDSHVAYLRLATSPDGEPQVGAGGVRELAAEEGCVRAVSYLEEGDGAVAVIRASGGIRVCDAATGNLLGEFLREGSGAERAWFSADGLLSLLFYHGGDVELRETATSRLLFADSKLNDAALAAGGKHLMTLRHLHGHLFRIVVRNLPDLTVRSECEATADLSIIAIDPDAGMLACATWGSSYQVHLIDLRTGETRASLSAHSYRLSSLVFSPSGRALLSTCEDMSARLWSVLPRLTEDVLSDADRAAGKRLSALVAGSGSTPTSILVEGPAEPQSKYEWVELASGETLLEWTGASRDGPCEISPRGDAVVLRTGYSPERGWVFAHLQAPDVQKQIVRGLREVSFNATGTRFALGDRSWPPAAELFPVVVFDSATGEEVGIIRPQRDYVGFEVSPDGTLAATADRQHATLTIHDLATGTEKLSGAQHASWTIDVAWSPDGKLLASTAVDSRVRIWKADTLEQVLEVKGMPMAELQLQWSPSGKFLFARIPGGVTVIDPSAGLYTRIATLSRDTPSIVANDDWVFEYEASGVVRRHPLDPLAYAESLALRDFTSEEFEAYRLGSPQEATRLLERAAQHGITVRDQMALANHEQRAGDLDAAAAAVRRAVALRPDLADLRGELVDALVDLAGQTSGDPARSLLEEALPHLAWLVEHGVVTAEAIEQAPQLAPLRQLDGFQRLREAGKR